MSESLKNLQKLFNICKKYGNYTRSNGLNGFDQWLKLKDILSKNTIKGQWNEHVKKFFVEMRADLKLQECIDEIKNTDEIKKKDEWDKNHFYLQHARIPTLNYNDPSLLRLMQIAYNAGQLKSVYNDAFYTENLKKYYSDNKLDVMNTYMPDIALEQISTGVTDTLINHVLGLFPQTDVQKGGSYNYKYKYTKYKSKYINLTE